MGGLIASRHGIRDFNHRGESGKADMNTIVQRPEIAKILISYEYEDI